MITLILFAIQINYEDDVYLINQLLPLLKSTYDDYFKTNLEQDAQKKKGILLWARGLIMFLIEQDDYKKSIRLLNESLELLKEYHQEVLTLISFIYLSFNMAMEAIEYNNKVISLNDRNFEAIAN